MYKLHPRAPEKGRERHETERAILRRSKGPPSSFAKGRAAVPALRLQALLLSSEPRVLLLALRHVVQAQGIANVAKVGGIERESLYRALSLHGNPRFSTLAAVTRAIGLRLTVEAAS
jgi:probable addiction module antidote protein